MQQVTLDSQLSELLPPKEAQAIERAFGYSTVADLVLHYPRRYDPRGALTPIRGLPVGEHVTVIAEVVQVTERRMQRRNGSIIEATITDGKGEMKLTWFNQAWRKEALAPGQRGLFSGKVTEYRSTLQLAHPEYQIFTEETTISEDEAEREALVSSWRSEVVPIYPATGKVSSWDIQRAMERVLTLLSVVEDPLPDDIRAEAGALFAAQHGEMEATAAPIVDFGTAMQWLHRPTDMGEQRLAKESMLFREAFELQLGLLDAKRRAGSQNTAAWPKRPGKMLEAFDAALPFALTDDQAAVGLAIEQGLAQTEPMHRLLQGEVASGKTLVALRAMLQVADAGGQSALLAPTEVLASQHLRSITETLGPELTEALRPTLLTGQLSVPEKRRALLDIVSGNAKIVVGTHALMSANTEFHDLGFIVIDEQHRFGVEQRDALRKKGKRPPHVLVMTATPIPRTIALTAFGDLDVSTIRQLPRGRMPIVTHVVPTDEQPRWEHRAWQRAAEEIERGRQIYVVCPAISPTEQETGGHPPAGDTGQAGAPGSAGGPGSSSGPGGGDVREQRPLANVEETLAMLGGVPELRDVRMAALTGAMAADDKDAVMKDFAAGSIDLLVATTVIEVGVNVPNASMMIIRDAHRFGVSQLHQLRGRVGRGAHEGLCLLVTYAPQGSSSRERIQAVASTNDGFELAEYDLQVRREGDLLGARQSGTDTGLQLLRVQEHGEIIAGARDIATKLLDRDPELSTVPALSGLIRAGRENDIENLTKS